MGLSDHDGDLTLVRSVTFDENGIPRFDDILSERPSEKGASFTLVHYSEKKPVTSYDVTIVDGKDPDLLKPLEVIYEWTGKGFMAGLSVTSEVPYYMDINAHFACIPEAVGEINHVLIDRQEVLFSFTRYAYDDRGRLSRMRTFHPSDPPVEVVTTEFLYAGEGLVPSETRVISRPEGTIRTVE